MKNVFLKNIQQHVRHSAIISHIVADPPTWGRWRGISRMTTTGEVWRQTETHSWSFVFAHIKKLSLKEKERKGWKEMSAKGWGGGDRAASAQLEKEAEPPALQPELPRLTPTPIPTSLQGGWDLNLSIWPGLRKRNATLFRHLGNEAQWRQHRTIQKTLRNSETHPGFFSPNLILPQKIQSFFDIYIEEMCYNPPIPLVYPCQCADLGS